MVLFFFLVGYLIGSFPTAYFIVKKFTGRDIRKEETGNVGAMNTAQATGKFYLFFIVFIIDAFKGFLGVYIPQIFSYLNYDLILAVTFGAFGVVLGHCYSIYFKIKDGKFAGGKAIASLFRIFSSNFFVRDSHLCQTMAPRHPNAKRQRTEMVFFQKTGFEEKVKICLY